MSLAQAPTGGPKRLTREQIIRLVEARADVERLIETVKERGLGFELTEKVLDEMCQHIFGLARAYLGPEQQTEAQRQELRGSMQSMHWTATQLPRRQLRTTTVSFVRGM